MMTISTRCHEKRPDTLPSNLVEWMGKRELVGLVLQAVTEAVGFCHEPCVTDSEGKPIRLQVILGLVCYCYATGVYGSWQIEEKISTDEAARYLAANSHPDRQILRRFRRHGRVEIAQCLARIFALAWGQRCSAENAWPSRSRFMAVAEETRAEDSPLHPRFLTEAEQRIDCAMQYDRIEVED